MKLTAPLIMKTMLILMTTTTTVLFSVMVGAIARAADYVDSGGIKYTMTTNKNGVVLKSKTETIYLGKDCDAYSRRYGKGTWGWANGGVSIELQKGKIGFPRQGSPFKDNRCPL
jgi:hypothetical protein